MPWKKQKFVIGCKQLEVVKRFVNLGYSNHKMSTNKNTKQLAIKGKAALGDVLRLHKQMNQMNWAVFFKMFDTKIQLIVTYCFEV